MMKRVISLLLIVAMIFPFIFIITFAEENEEYVSVNIEYSDKRGSVEQLELMQKNGNVFANAEMLVKRLGYEFGSDDECIIVINRKNDELPYGVTQFFLDSTKVSQTLYTNINDSFEAPFASVKNEHGCWIPLEYSLLILNSGLLLVDDCLLVDIPEKDIIDYYYDIAKNINVYGFDWNKDFGYAEYDWKIIGFCSHYINVLNGLLESDSDSWGSLFQFFIKSSSYDKKFGEDLALLLCTESDSELEALINKMEIYQDVFSPKGKLGSLLADRADYLDAEVKMLYENCESILKDVKRDNNSAAIYNKSYQAFQNALDRKTWFSKTGGNIVDVQEGLSEATDILDILLKIGEVVDYGKEFVNQDEFSLNSLINYLDTSTRIDALSVELVDSMQEHTKVLSSNIAQYSATRFIKNNIDGWISDGLSLSKALGTQANMALFSWNLASNVVPFISHGLDGAENFELALYAKCFQEDTLSNYLRLIENSFRQDGELTPDMLYQISQYCYIYLKSCYVTRNVALASLITKRDSIKKQIQPLIDYQNSINQDIAEAMVLLKSANKSNEGNIYGFLPFDNKAYLKDFDNSSLNSWIEKCKQINQDVFARLPSEFIFSSGVGAWSTGITLNDDGTFDGEYSDSDMGNTGIDYPNGTVHICKFKGKFSVPELINEYVYSMRLEFLEVEGEVGNQYVENGILYINSEPYGFDDADEFLVYLPGCSLEEVSEEFLSWSQVNSKIRKTIPSGVYGIYNVSGMKGFMGEDDNTLWKKSYIYNYNNYKSELWPSYYSMSHLIFWPETGAAILDLTFNWTDDNQTEFIASDSKGTGDYSISLNFSEDYNSVSVTVKSLTGSDLTSWGGTIDGILAAEYQIK